MEKSSIVSKWTCIELHVHEVCRCTCTSSNMAQQQAWAARHTAEVIALPSVVSEQEGKNKQFEHLHSLLSANKQTSHCAAAWI